MARSGNTFYFLERWLSRNQEIPGKRRLTPAYERSSTSNPDWRAATGDCTPCPPPAVERPPGASHDLEDAQTGTENVLGFRARVSNGPGSFLSGLGKEMAASSSAIRDRQVVSKLAV